jgi:hypothetical protein
MLVEENESPRRHGKGNENENENRLTDGFRRVKVNVVHRPRVPGQLVLHLAGSNAPDVDVPISRPAPNVLAVWSPCTLDQVLLKPMLSSVFFFPFV